MGLAEIRRNAAKAKGNDYSIFDLNNGLDLIINLKKGSDGKTATQILDSGIPSPISDDYETGEKWIHDEKKWYEVYTVKSYDYMSVISMGGVPIYDKELGKYVDKDEMNRIREEAENKRIEEQLTEETKDYSEIATSNEIVVDATTKADESQDEDLPF
jgi:hypothetical protein